MRGGTLKPYTGQPEETCRSHSLTTDYDQMRVVSHAPNKRRGKMFNRNKIKEFERKVRDLEFELERRKELADKNSQLTAENTLITTKYNDTVKKVHDQTEADLYLECKKIMQEIEKGKTVAELQPHIDFRKRLQSQLAQQQPASPFGMGFFGALGLRQQ